MTSFVVLVNGGIFLSFLRLPREILIPLLFIIVIEALNKLLLRGTERGLIKGIRVVVGEQAVEFTHLFFADNTLVFCELDERVLLNLRCILLCFQAVPGSQNQPCKV